MTEPHYRAFISYSHADEKWARWLHRGLERYRVPRKLVVQHGLDGNRLLPIFRDRDELSTSSSLGTVIEAALAASDNLIVVCSPAAASSQWVNEEIKAFRALGREEKIFCLIVDGADGECFPPALQEDEPLGADLRPGGDGKQSAKLKIVSGLLGFSFAELKDRQARRRNRVLGLAAAASIAVTGVMTALTISAVLAGREAERNRVVATEALEDAEAVAGFLSKMLAGLDPDAMGQTIVGDIGQQAPDVTLPPDINGTNTARRLLDEHLLSGATDAVRTQFASRPAINARLERSIGDAYQAIGLYAQAIEVNNAAAGRYREEFGELDSRTLEAEQALSLARLYEGQFDQAMAGLERNLSLSRQIHGGEHAQTISAMNSLAMAYMDTGRTEQARGLLETASELIVAQDGPESPSTLNVRSNLAWVLYLLEDFAAAEALNVELLEIKRRVLGPEAYETLVTLNNLAMIYRRTGRYEQAEAAHREELTISRRTMGADHPEVLVSTLNLSRVLVASGQFDAAAALLDEAYETATRILPPLHPLLGAVTVAYGDSKLQAGDTDGARELYLAARTIYEALVEPGHSLPTPLEEKLAAIEPRQPQ